MGISTFFKYKSGALLSKAPPAKSLPLAGIILIAAFLALKPTKPTVEYQADIQLELDKMILQMHKIYDIGWACSKTQEPCPANIQNGRYNNNG